jgi:uncharacterized membrane protein
MPNQFISPNWHVLLLHYPIAFLSVGILIELFSFFWPRGYFRAAGRWMLLLGGLLAIPTLVVGLYAFREAVGHGHGGWHQVMAASSWSDSQRQYMTYHIWFNSIGTALAAVAVVMWIAGSDMFRRSVHWIVALFFILAMCLFSIGAWFGGESVYRMGTAVESWSMSITHADVVRGQAALNDEESSSSDHGIKWFIPPLELHATLAGFAVALSVLALALTIRRLEKTVVTPVADDEQIPPEGEASPTTLAAGKARPPFPGAAVPSDPVSGDPLRDRVTVETESVGPARTHLVIVTEPPVLFPGRFWMLAFVLFLLTAAAGIWSVTGNFSPNSLRANVDELKNTHAHLRLLLHLAFGVSIIALTVILAGVARWGRRKAGATRILLLLAVLAIAVQFWLGILLLFDGGRGSIFRFNSATSATQPARGA